MNFFLRRFSIYFYRPNPFHLLPIFRLSPVSSHEPVNVPYRRLCSFSGEHLNVVQLCTFNKMRHFPVRHSNIVVRPSCAQGARDDLIRKSYNILVKPQLFQALPLRGGSVSPRRLVICLRLAARALLFRHVLFPIRKAPPLYHGFPVMSMAALKVLCGGLAPPYSGRDDILVRSHPFEEPGTLSGLIVKKETGHSAPSLPHGKIDHPCI